MKELKSFLKDDLLGVHLAVNIFIATTVLWLLLRLGANTSPIWAISAMIPALDPQMKQAVTNFRGRIFNALLGCVTGLLFLLVGGTSEWKLPLALSATVLLSSYVVNIPITGSALRANRLVSYGGTRPTYVTRSWLRCAGNDNRKSPTA